MKKYRKSPIAIACYVIAALVLVYCIYVASTTLATINEYYAAYGMSAEAGETITYLLQNCLSPLTTAILICMAGFILDEVRKANPANWFEVEAKAAEVETAEAAEDNENADEAVEAADEAVESDTTEAEAADSKEDQTIVEFEGKDDAEDADQIVEFPAEAEEAAEEVAAEAEAVEEAAEEVAAEAEAVEEAAEEVAEKAAENK